TEITDSNAAFFDATHHFAGCIAGLHEVLRRQGLLEGIWCLDPRETLSPGQQEEISRVLKAYPHLNDDDFVRERRDRWLRPIERSGNRVRLDYGIAGKSYGMPQRSVISAIV